jgi:hypothetical protein
MNVPAPLFLSPPPSLDCFKIIDKKHQAVRIYVIVPNEICGSFYLNDS